MAGRLNPYPDLKLALGFLAGAPRSLPTCPMPWTAAGAQTTPPLFFRTHLLPSMLDNHMETKGNRLCFGGVAQGQEDFESSLS